MMGFTALVAMIGFVAQVNAATNIPAQPPTAQFRQADNNTLTITQGDKQWQIEQVFSSTNSNQYVALSTFNERTAIYYAAFMDQVYFTFDAKQANLIDCVYIDLVSAINIPIRKFRCGIKQPFNANWFDQYRQLFSGTLSPLLDDASIAEKVAKQHQVAIPISQNADFKLLAYFNSNSLAQGTPTLVLQHKQQQVTLPQHQYYVAYEEINGQLTATELYQLVEPNKPILEHVSIEQTMQQAQGASLGE
ncbi:hypothetical protein [Motilimonas pumila]|uniref:Uncharacterized protein n=1 Tax=Motilimonas pumila TaxID=2303987 RepID=A0A418YD94_9GAMM|nr:hypothetical protein [Motilimonas pumila]RJG42493.1 hypothetical protein D1Z90_12550 [Motilimonas pumila]